MIPLVTPTEKTHRPCIPHPLLRRANIAHKAFLPIRMVRPSKLNSYTNVLPYRTMLPSNAYRKTHLPSNPYPIRQQANIALNAFLPIRLVRPSKLLYARWIVF